MVVRHQWPKEGVSRIPYWVYTDPEIYAREQERIFCGRSWAYVALEAEIQIPGDFKRSYKGLSARPRRRHPTDGGVRVAVHASARDQHPHLGVEEWVARGARELCRVRDLRDELTRVFSVGRCHDKLVVVNGKLEFKQKLVIFDSELIPTSLV